MTATVVEERVMFEEEEEIFIPCQNMPGWCEKYGNGVRGRAEWVVTYPGPWNSKNPYLICERCFQRGITYGGFVHAGATWRRL